MANPNKRVEYLAPAPESIERLAKTACREMGCGNSPEMVTGLANFLKAFSAVVAESKTKSQNGEE